MPRNLELKARIRSVSSAVAVARKLRARKAAILHQVDIYYRVPAGRLKLRIIDRESAELIAYERPDKRGGRYSEYLVIPVKNSGKTDKMFRRLLGVKAIVRKTRRLYLYRNARIHIDTVHSLGSFIEFEVIVSKGKTQARQLFEILVREFGIRAKETIAGSYSDMRRR
jgi:predicted adenylyl cyclase CyaB